jgi:hypothetical protein
MHALQTTAACWSQGVRHIAGTVRMLWREITPSWSIVLTWLPQFSTWTLAHRKHSED